MVTHSKTIYDENFNQLTLKNINEVDNKEIPAHDILTGGSCQPFSRLQVGLTTSGLTCSGRSSIIDYHKPDCVILRT
jgi:site-specific DNA-cytosine methylase